MRSLFLSILIMCAAPAAAERMIVVGATGPSANMFPRGTVLDGSRGATLLPLDRVVVVDKDGTRVFSGPGAINFGRGTATPSRWDDIRTLVSRTRDTFRRKGRARAGATRGAPAEMPPNDRIYAIEWPAGGRYCFDPEIGMYTHVRPGPDAPEKISFVDLADRDKEAEEVAGRSHVAWPQELLPKPGEERDFSVSAGGVTRTVTLAAVPVRDLDPLALAEFVTARRCEYPLSMFADKADQLESR